MLIVIGIGCFTIPIGLVVLYRVFNKRVNSVSLIVQDSKEASPNTPALVKRAIAIICGPKMTNMKGETLTKFEFQWMCWRLTNELPACIDCEKGKLLEGPSGGISTNVVCNNKLCGSKFNFTGDLEIDRITDASPNKPRQMVNLGPHR